MQQDPCILINMCLKIKGRTGKSCCVIPDISLPPQWRCLWTQRASFSMGRREGGGSLALFSHHIHQERMKVREVIPHIGPIPIVIPLKLFLEGIDFLADNVTSRVTCLSPFLILQRLHVITIIHFHKKNCFSRYFQRISKKYM